jgi:hypothetical protein
MDAELSGVLAWPKGKEPGNITIQERRHTTCVLVGCSADRAYVIPKSCGALRIL